MDVACETAVVGGVTVMTMGVGEDSNPRKTIGATMLEITAVAITAPAPISAVVIALRSFGSGFFSLIETFTCRAANAQHLPHAVARELHPTWYTRARRRLPRDARRVRVAFHLRDTLRAFH